MAEPTTVEIEGEDFSLDQRKRVSTKDLKELAEEIHLVIDVDPAEITKDYIEAQAQDLGPKIFDKIFGNDPDVLAQRTLQTPNTLKKNEIYRTYFSNWNRLIETLRNREGYEWIRASEKDWKGVRTLLRRMYRPFAVAELAKKSTDEALRPHYSEEKAKERLTWDVLVALQTERFQIKAIEGALAYIFSNGKALDKHDARSKVRREAVEIRTKKLLKKLRDQNKRAGVLDALEKRADRQTVLLSGLKYIKDPEEKTAVVKELTEMGTRIDQALAQIQHIEQFVQNGKKGQTSGDPTEKAFDKIKADIISGLQSSQGGTSIQEVILKIAEENPDFVENLIERMRERSGDPRTTSAT